MEQHVASCTTTLQAESSTVLLGDPVRLTASASCDEPGNVELQWIRVENGSTRTVLQTWAPGTTLTAPTHGTAPGTHAYRVFARLVGRTAEFASPFVNVTVKDTAPVCTSVKWVAPSGRTLPAGIASTLTAEATCPPGATPEVDFWYRPQGTTGWQKLGYGAASRAWTPATAGTWELAAAARSQGAYATYQVINQRTVEVTSAPIAHNDTLATTQNVAAALDVLANDLDAEDANGALTLTAVTQANRGTVTFSGRVVTYTPSAGYSGPDSFKYTVADTAGNTALGTVNVSIGRITQACSPVISGPAQSPSGSAIQLVVAPGCPEGTAVTEWWARGPVGNAFKLAAYDPATTATYTNTATIGTYSFYALTKPLGATAVAPVRSNTLLVNVKDSTPACTALKWVAPAPTTSSVGRGSVTLTTVATCPQGVTPEYDYWVRPASTTVWTKLGYGAATRTWTPSTAGSWHVWAYARAQGAQAAYQVANPRTVTVQAGAPVAAADELVVIEDTATDLPVLANDHDPDGQVLTIVAVTQPAHGVVATTGTVLSYAPSANYHGADVFTYTISDGTSTSTAEVRVLVDERNDAPVASDDTVTVAQGSRTPVSVLANDSDADGEPLAVSIATGPQHGTATTDGVTIEYVPAPAFHGQDTIEYQVSDGRGGVASATVQVTVTSSTPNRAPVAIDDAFDVDEGAYVLLPVMQNDGDDDGDLLQITDVVQPTLGYVYYDAYSLHYSAYSEDSGFDQFTYTISDGRGGTATATVVVQVKPTADAPVAYDDLLMPGVEDTAYVIDADTLTSNDADPDGDTFTVSGIVADGRAHGSVQLANGVLTYTPQANYFGPAAFFYVLRDSTGLESWGLVSFEVASTQDPPRCANDDVSTPRDVTVAIEPLRNDFDPDGDVLGAVVVTSGPSHGVASVSGSTITYEPAPGFVGADQLTYTASDGSATSQGSVTIEVTDPAQPASSQIVDLAAREASACAVRDDGSLWCWGEHSETQMFAVATPVQIGPDLDWVQVATGASHRCAIKQNGTLWCWGNGSYGQLGDGSAQSAPEPVRVDNNHDWAKVTAGAHSTCALKQNSSLWCWGLNELGQTGQPITSILAIELPSQVSGVWSDVALGDAHACATRPDQTLWCWGSDLRNQLGDDQQGSTHVQQQIAGSWKHLASGGDQTCGVKVDGTTWCWGNGSLHAQVGTDAGWERVAVGGRHACAIDADQQAACWGLNYFGQLGDGSQTDSQIPAPVATGTWNDLALGANFSCGIETNGGLYCWGMNLFNQLGTGASVDKAVPTATTLTSDAASLAVGGHTCVVKLDGSLWCTGGNGSGELGDGTNVIRAGFTRVPGANDWRSVATVPSRTCAVKTDDTLWCWGYSQPEMTIPGGTTSTPVLVGTGWKSFAMSQQHQCGIKTDDTVWCWGSNYSGESNASDATLISVPTQVAPGAWASVELDVRGTSTCATRQDGTLWCWGGVVSSRAPVQLGSDATWRDVSTSSLHACATKADGTLWCFGKNFWGQLGVAGVSSATEPVQVSGAGWADVTTSFWYSCATRVDGTAWCWGFGGHALGMGLTSKVRFDIPARVTGSGFTRIEADTDATCGIKQDGSTWCWGAAGSGQLGTDDAFRRVPTRSAL